MAKTDVFGARTPFPGKDGVSYYRLAKLQEDGIANIDRLLFSIKILLEAVLRNHDDYVINADDVKKLANWKAVEAERQEDDEDWSGCQHESDSLRVLRLVPPRPKSESVKASTVASDSRYL